MPLVRGSTIPQVRALWSTGLFCREPAIPAAGDWFRLEEGGAAAMPSHICLRRLTALLLAAHLMMTMDALELARGVIGMVSPPLHVRYAAARRQRIAGYRRLSVATSAMAIPGKVWLDGDGVVSGSKSDTRGLADSIRGGALVLELAGVVSDEECLLLVDAAKQRAAAGKGQNVRGQGAGVQSSLTAYLSARVRIPSIAAAQRASRAWGGDGTLKGLDPLPKAADDAAEAIFRRVLARIDEQLPSLVTTLFDAGGASEYSLAARHAAGGLEFANREPAVNIYTTGGQFPAHKDYHALTMLLSLSPPTSFTGGGTGFWRGDDAVGEPAALLRPEPGTVLLWGGDVMHAGMQVESGTRCVYVASFSTRGSERRRAESAAQSRGENGDLYVHPSLRFDHYERTHPR